MKNQYIKSILSSVLLVSFALVPVSAVLADENEDLNSSSTSTTTKYERGGDKKEEGNNNEWNNGSSTASSTIKGDDRKEKEDKNDKKDEKDNKKHGEKFKIDSAKITENLLKLSDKLGTLGTQIKAIVNDQASSSNAIASAVSRAEERGAFKTFLLGADYKNLGQVISEVAKTQARINQLDNQVSKMASSTDKTAVLANIQTLKDQTVALETFVKDNINKFSLFGWFTKRFNK